MMYRILVVSFFSMLLFACNKKYICPAFNTYFIHDEKVRKSMFSYFNSEDSTSESVNSEMSTHTDAPADSTGAGEAAASGKASPKLNGEVVYQNSGIIASNKKKQATKLNTIKMEFIPAKPEADYKDTLYKMKSDTI